MAVRKSIRMKGGNPIQTKQTLTPDRRNQIVKALVAMDRKHGAGSYNAADVVRSLQPLFHPNNPAHIDWIKQIAREKGQTLPKHGLSRSAKKKESTGFELSKKMEREVQRVVTSHLTEDVSSVRVRVIVTQLKKNETLFGKVEYLALEEAVKEKFNAKSGTILNRNFVKKK